MQVKVEFDTTPKMSTYLAAWVIAPFQSISAETETNKINVSVVTSKEKIDQVTILIERCIKKRNKSLDKVQNQKETRFIGWKRRGSLENSKVTFFGPGGDFVVAIYHCKRPPARARDRVGGVYQFFFFIFFLSKYIFDHTVLSGIICLGCCCESDRKL